MKPPVTLANFPPEWIAERREIIVRDGHAVRAGERDRDLSGEPFTIEIKSLTTNVWLRLTLPGGAETFTTREDRDVVLKQLTEG